jgi:hypothetical protein
MSYFFTITQEISFHTSGTGRRCLWMGERNPAIFTHDVFVLSSVMMASLPIIRIRHPSVPCHTQNLIIALLHEV